MEGAFDANAPDCTNGDFFCKVCLASMNSEQTWASHIVGRRHIKNVQKYPNGLPNRYDNEESYDGAENDESYGKDGDYPPAYDDYYYGQDYYDRDPVDYVPAVRPNVVIDYGHSKKLDELLPAPITEYRSGKEQQSSKVEPHIGKMVNVDQILNEIKSKTLKNGQESKKDNFFAKINQRELARDLALELSKSRFYKNDVKATDKSLKSEETSKRKQDSKCEDEKRSKRRSSPDLIDMIHKYNDDKLFKGSKIKDNKHSSSSKLDLKLKTIDPDKLTTDVLDDLLSSRLKPKTDSSSKTSVKSIEKKTEVKVNLDDPEVIAEKLQNLPNKTFFEIVQNKLKKIELKDSEEAKMLLKLVFEAQEVVTKKLPPHVQSAAKAKLSENNSERKEEISASPSQTIVSVGAQSSSTGITHSVPSTSSQTQNTVVSQNYNVPLVSSHVQNTAGIPNYPAIPTVPQFPNPAPVPVSSSFPGSIPGTSALISSTQTLPAGFPGVPPRLPVPPNSAVYPSLYQFQNFQANSAMFYQMMHAMYQNRQPVPTTNVNTVPTTLPSSSPARAPVPAQIRAPIPAQVQAPIPAQVQAPVATPTPNSQPPRLFPPDLASAKNLQAALQQLQTLAEEYRSRKQSNEEPKEKSNKESSEESKEKYRKESNEESKEKYRKESKSDTYDKYRKDYKSDSKDKYRREYSSSRKDFR